MSDYVIHFTGMITEDGKQLLIDNQGKLKADYKFLAGYEIEGVLRKRRSKRTLRQNSWLHAAIKPLADHIGSTTEELKLDLLGITFGWRETSRGNKLPNILHTSDLNTQQFGELMDTLLIEAAKEQVVILLPDEFRAAKKKQARQLQRRGAGVAPADRTGRRSIATRQHDNDPEGIEPLAAPENQP